MTSLPVFRQTFGYSTLKKANVTKETQKVAGGDFDISLSQVKVVWCRYA